jgi:hypothetical protein
MIAGADTFCISPADRPDQKVPVNKILDGTSDSARCSHSAIKRNAFFGEFLRVLASAMFCKPQRTLRIFSVFSVVKSVADRIATHHSPFTSRIYAVFPAESCG